MALQFRPSAASTSGNICDVIGSTLEDLIARIVEGSEPGVLMLTFGLEEREPRLSDSDSRLSRVMLRSTLCTLAKTPYDPSG
jgi:hypothetical protein